MTRNRSKLDLDREQITLALREWKEEVNLRAFGATCPMPHCGALAVTYECSDNLSGMLQSAVGRLGVRVSGMRSRIHRAWQRSSLRVSAARMAVRASFLRVKLHRWGDLAGSPECCSRPLFLRVGMGAEFG